MGLPSVKQAIWLIGSMLATLLIPLAGRLAPKQTWGICLYLESVE